MTSADKMETPSLEEERPVTQSSIDDFSHEAIKKYLEKKNLSYKIPSSELWAFFTQAKYLVKRGNKNVPTLVGIVVFGKNPLM